ncbi:MAG: hypothetical protein KDE59_00290 [Anaerolineales bacterium]|nr:hypothetical protein [Anaerolineales bacterium]
MHSGGWTDIYVLTEKRSSALIERFLQTFLPERAESADDYAVRCSSEGDTLCISQVSTAIQYCCQHSMAELAIYWRNTGPGTPRAAMVFFTTDEHLILGLSVANESAAPEYLKRLRLLADSEYGYMAYEEPPIMTAVDFRAVNRANLP